jgi:hypothetical protein
MPFLSFQFHCFWILFFLGLISEASVGYAFSAHHPSSHLQLGRRDAISMGILTLFPISLASLASYAYTPDSDALRESLYLLCRVQEATCLQERYIQKKAPPIQKMKLTLRLVDRSYRLLDQINYISKFIPPDDIVLAVQVGNEAVDSLQDAIDFVNQYDKGGDSMTVSQREFLIESLANAREKLFEFVAYLPNQDKLQEARLRVQEENKLNQDEFDPDLANDAGVYNPIELPWKNRST